VICTTHKYNSGDQIEKNEFGEACGTYGEEGRCIEDFGGKPDGTDRL
jgi:hypothetical protein